MQLSFDRPCLHMLKLNLMRKDTRLSPIFQGESVGRSLPVDCSLALQAISARTDLMLCSATMYQHTHLLR